MKKKTLSVMIADDYNEILNKTIPSMITWFGEEIEIRIEHLDELQCYRVTAIQ